MLAQVRDISGRVDVLLHAAGVEISHALPDKEPREFDLVLGVKVDGLFNVLHAVGDLPLGTVVAFSSVAGRFGNVGQTDYSAANDLQCKVLQQPAPHPSRRAGARDRLDRLGRHRHGHPRIDPEDHGGGRGGHAARRGGRGVDPARADHRRRRPARSSSRARWARWPPSSHDTGGHRPGGADRRTGRCSARSSRASVHDGLVVRTTLDPTARPFLDHHRIDGTAVLPGVMGMEAFAEAARLLAPDWHVAAVENVDFRAPLKFYRDEPRTLTITALLRPDGDDLVAECRLSAERKVPGADEPQRTVHFTGSVRLTAEPPALDAGSVVPEGNSTLSPEQVYRLYFHGPAYQVVGAAWQHGDGAAGRFAADLPPQVDGPAADRSAAGGAVLPDGRACSRPAPTATSRCRCTSARCGSTGCPQERAGLVATVRRDGNGGFDCIVRDDDGMPVLRLDGYRTVPLPDPPPEDVVAPIRAVMGA